MFKSRKRKLAGESLESRKFLHGGGFGGMAGLDGGGKTIDEQVEATFERYDKNDDGTLNAEDSLSTRVQKRIAGADADTNGGVTVTELTQFWEADKVSKLLGIGDSSRPFIFCGEDAIADRVSSAIELVDDDADGSIDQSEVSSSLWKDVSTADTNGDLALSSDELTTYAEALQAEAQAELIADAVDSLMSRLDSDDDGAITSTEVSERRWSRIADADADDNGSISKDELTAYVTEQVTSGEIGNSIFGHGGRGGHGLGGVLMGRGRR